MHHSSMTLVSITSPAKRLSCVSVSLQTKFAGYLWAGASEQNQLFDDVPTAQEQEL